MESYMLEEEQLFGKANMRIWVSTPQKSQSTSLLLYLVLFR